MTDDSLYERLGGQTAVDAVVDEFYDRVLDDDLRPYSANTDTDKLRDHQRASIAHVAGGADYDGPGMEAVHAHLDVTDAAFDRVADHLDDSLRAYGVDDPEREAVMTAVAGLRDEVVSA